MKRNVRGLTRDMSAPFLRNFFCHSMLNLYTGLPFTAKGNTTSTNEDSDDKETNIERIKSVIVAIPDDTIHKTILPLFRNLAVSKS